jgi:hypothetical protein
LSQPVFRSILIVLRSKGADAVDSPVSSREWPDSLEVEIAISCPDFWTNVFVDVYNMNFA